MPRFKITDSQTGRSVIVSGDSAPNDQDAEGIFAEAGLRNKGGAPEVPDSFPRDAGPPSPVADPNPLHSKTASNIASEAMGAADPIFGANQMLQHGVYGAGQLITSAGGLYPNKVSNWMDEAAKGGDKIYGMANDALAKERESAGLSGFDAHRLVGNVASPVGALSKAKTFGEALASGAAYGASQPLDEGASQAERIGNTVMGTAGGATGYGASKAVEGAGAAYAAAMGRKADMPPLTKDIKQAGSDLYKSAAAQGIIVSKNSFADMADKLKAQMADEAIDATNHPKALAALNRIDAKTGENITLKGIEMLRRGASDATEGATKSDKRLSRMIIDHIDDYVDSLGAQDVVGNADPKGATETLSAARELWKRGAKGETIDGLIKKAELNAPKFGQSGYENSLRTQFSKLANSDRGMARFSPEEQAAIRKVAMGGPVENALRQVGKLAPVGYLPMSMELGAAMLHPAAIAAPIAGAVGRVGATAMTGRNAQIASELMRRGAPSTPAKLSSRTQAMIQALQGGGNAVGRLPAPILNQLLSSGGGVPAAR